MNSWANSVRGLLSHLCHATVNRSTRSLTAQRFPPTHIPASCTLTARSMASSNGSVEPEILTQRDGALGLITLNRPKALNALNTVMVDNMYAVLKDWEKDPHVAAVVVKGAGEKSFCAGGDVKAVVQLGLADRVHDALAFFRDEYHQNHLIATYAKPYVALMDGITMGGGAGISVHGTFRVATERTLFAMPECAIGLFPDIGASYFLPRLPGALGMYLGLAGARLSASLNIDCGGTATVAIVVLFPRTSTRS